MLWEQKFLHLYHDKAHFLEYDIILKHRCSQSDKMKEICFYNKDSMLNFKLLSGVDLEDEMVLPKNKESS